MKRKPSEEALHLIDSFKTFFPQAITIDNLLLLIDRAIEFDSIYLFEAAFIGLTRLTVQPVFPNKPLFGDKLISRGLNAGKNLIQTQLNFVNFDNIQRPIFYDLTKEHVLNPFIYYLFEKIRLWSKVDEAIKLIFDLNLGVNFGATQWSTQAIRQENGLIKYSFTDTGSNLFHLIINNDPAIFDDYLSFALLPRLVRNGVDINAKDKNGHTPLYLACKKGNLDIIRFLLNNEADKTCFDEIRDFSTSLTNPMLHLDQHVIRLLASFDIRLPSTCYIKKEHLIKAKQDSNTVNLQQEEDPKRFDDFDDFLNSKLSSK